MHWQEGEAKPPVAAPLSARVLDVSKADGIVDLSAAPALLPPPADAGKRAKKEPRADKWKVQMLGRSTLGWGASNGINMPQGTAEDSAWSQI